MGAFLLSVLLAQSGFFLEHFGSRGLVGKAMGGLADKVITVRISSDDDEGSGDEIDTDNDVDSDLEVLPPVPPTPPLPPIPPMPPLQRVRKFPAPADGPQEPARFTEQARNVPTAEVLHRIAQAGGWSVTLVGSPRERIDIDVKDAEPREALRQVLTESGAMAVLKNDKLVVVAAPGMEGAAGKLIEKSSSSRRGGAKFVHGKSRRGSRDMVRVFQGDLTVPQGQIVQGDVVCVGGSIELDPGSVVQGDAVAVGGSVTVNGGALVMGQAVAVLGAVNVEPGGQVMGEHVQLGLGKMLPRSPKRHRGWLTGLGPFGLFPTIALFALIYLIGLMVLRMWPERVRNVGFALFESPVRSFTVGFLCWLLLLPLIVLLAISIVGIPLIPLLPVIIFLSIVMGLSSFALRVGEALPAGPGQRFVPPAALGMGMAVLLLVAFVPWLGISILALLQFFALGASVGSRFGRALPPHVP